MDAKEPVCCPNIELDEIEEIFFNIVYWARNKKKNLEECIRNRFTPGPLGVITKKNLWVPIGSESCNADLYGFQGKNSYNPYRIREHCLSESHIRFLVKYRSNYVFKKTFKELDPNEIGILFKMVHNRSFPLYINSNIWIISTMAKDFLETICIHKDYWK